MVARSAQQSPPCEKCGKRNEQRRALKNGAGLLANDDQQVSAKFTLPSRHSRNDTSCRNPRQAPVLARRCEFPAAFRLADTFGATFR